MVRGTYPKGIIVARKLSTSSPDAGAVSHQVVAQQRTYGFDPDDKRWIIDQNGERVWRLPPLTMPEMRLHGEKVAIWDAIGRFLLLRME